jgi:hypothetical protein
VAVGNSTLRAIVFLVTFAAGAACQSTPSVPTPEPAQPTATLDANACKQRIAALDLADEAKIADVAACRFTPGGETAARQALVTGGTRDQLWAAVWIYGSTARDAAPLLPLAGQTDPSIRAIVGAALASLGERPGLDALAASLSDAGVLAGSSPPASIASFGVFSLRRVVNAPIALSTPNPDAGRTDDSAAWRDWLAAHAAQLVFDQGNRRWTLP